MADALAANEPGIRYTLSKVLRLNGWYEEDILQDAREFLVKCWATYDPSRNSSFMNYYSKFLFKRIMRLMLRNGRCVSVKTSANMRSFVSQRGTISRIAFSDRDESEAHYREIAVSLGVDKEWLDETSVAYLMNIMEFKSVPDLEWNEHIDTPFRHQFPTGEDGCIDDDAWLVMNKFCDSLQGRDLVIFRERFMADDPTPLQAIGDRYGISRERVRQLETRLRKRLKEYCGELGCL